MPGMPNLYPSTLQNLLVGLQGGLDPADAYGMLNDAMAQQEQRQSYLHQLREEREAEQEARRQARQQTFANLGSAVFEGAAGGMTPEAVQSQLEFLTAATPGVGPRMEGRLEDLVDQAYPRTPAPFTDIPASVAVKGTEREIMDTRTAMGPRAQTSPLYVPPPEEPSTTNLMDIMVPQTNRQGQPILSEDTGKPLEQPQGALISAATTNAIRQGIPMQEHMILTAQDLAAQGYGADVITAAQQQIELMYQLTPPPPPPEPRRTLHARGTVNAASGSAGLPLTNPIGGLR